jgi:hypothetical protein
MKIITNATPTSEITAVKVGDTISNGLGTFGEVEEIKFEDTLQGWHFIFALVGGGFIEAIKERKGC